MAAAISVGQLALKAMRGLFPPDPAAPAPVASDNSRLRELCTEMESIFLSVLMRQMRQTVTRSDFLPQAAGEDMFKSLWEVEVADRVGRSGRGFGIADSIYNQLERHGRCTKAELLSPCSSL
ncbi:MAG: rod-binding protein [Planctomycetes bacterium]|nr:rod-binding protein [Planctomycetota bacterium]